MKDTSDQPKHLTTYIELGPLFTHNRQSDLIVFFPRNCQVEFELIQINAKEISLLAAFFDTNPEFWFNVQDNHERWVLRNKKPASDCYAGFAK